MQNKTNQKNIKLKVVKPQLLTDFLNDDKNYILGFKNKYSQELINDLESGLIDLKELKVYNYILADTAQNSSLYNQGRFIVTLPVTLETTNKNCPTKDYSVKYRFYPNYEIIVLKKHFESLRYLVTGQNHYYFSRHKNARFNQSESGDI